MGGKKASMSRTERILSLIDPHGYGLEIGPSHSPIAPKSEGFNVETIDHDTREGLIRKYRDHPVDINKIEEVDYVWRGERYPDLIGSHEKYDWIIASHVIEHTPDLIAFLRDCEAVLKPSGTLALAVPDKRYCFDQFRPISGLASVVDAHFAKRTTHSPGSMAEFYLNATSKGGKIGWDKNEVGKIEFIHTPEIAAQKMREAATQNTYNDIHSWCFTYSSFRLMVHDLFSLDLIQLSETESYDTTGCEFFIGLSKNGIGLRLSREELLHLTVQHD
ncbi:methyltransferase domain-containing protein [Pelagicoccus sp. NFK12]|uniref:Methyltransferase domain-containing protein n=1 Tax=Pelagicoccus enzymogenes TaxID=2773457 RepID=A0A927F5D0_9BACT|nr:methyltransferase domain-containing protein [Pelagicoccus enzymogenes]MBD5778704.1 methyltransferase domain-containing protein [Pelagicoccus enzymogenes]